MGVWSTPRHVQITPVGVLRSQLGVFVMELEHLLFTLHTQVACMCVVKVYLISYSACPRNRILLSIYKAVSYRTVQSVVCIEFMHPETISRISKILSWGKSKEPLTSSKAQPWLPSMFSTILASVLKNDLSVHSDCHAYHDKHLASADPQ